MENLNDYLFLTFAVSLLNLMLLSLVNIRKKETIMNVTNTIKTAGTVEKKEVTNIMETKKTSKKKKDYLDSDDLFLLVMKNKQKLNQYELDLVKRSLSDSRFDDYIEIGKVLSGLNLVISKNNKFYLKMI